MLTGCLKWVNRAVSSVVLRLPLPTQLQTYRCVAINDARGHEVDTAPAIDRNPHTSGPPKMDRPFEPVAASQTVFHDGARPPCVSIPIIPG